MSNLLTYTGDQDKLKEKGVPPYLPSTELKEAVNIAIALGRPLLLKGEPGCGKTRLAEAVAAELDLAYFEWSIKSTSRAQDGLYTYDTIGRLRDAQLIASPELAKAERAQLQARFNEPKSYIRWGELGRGFQKRFLGGKSRAVVLIDEIDKADIDFPNDLLHELDRKNFAIREVSETVDGREQEYRIMADSDAPPLIIITSNDEKELPDAFLRRCLFFYIDFPKTDILQKIVQAHMSQIYPAEQDPQFQDFYHKAIDRFNLLRQKMEQDKPQGSKTVSTSELLDWVKILKSNYYDPKKDEEGFAFPAMAQELLFPSVLLKNFADFAQYSGQERFAR